MGDFLEYLQERVLPEIGQMLDQKIAQGAAELGQALNSQADAYVPYGVGQAPLEVEGPATSYQDMLRESSSHGAGIDQEQNIER